MEPRHSPLRISSGGVALSPVDTFVSLPQTNDGARACHGDDTRELLGCGWSQSRPADAQ
jgi:hypothetical protein